ncbi:hypothetical protein B9Z55_009168 [Caenorhabditis nigoni]|nr:hypothetical protein B9Z55_009168 [Caenorhabditis nigoni]
MKLSKFPYLVQNEIFENLEHSDLFWMSLQSQNMKKLIKSSQAKRFQSISGITYAKFGCKWYVFIRFKAINNEPERVEFIMTMSEHSDDTKNVCFRLNVSGRIVGFRLSNEYPLPELYFHPIHKTSAFKAIHNCLLDYFGDTVKYIWITKSYPWIVKSRKQFIPQLPNLSVLSDFWPGDSEVKDNLEAYFAASPDLKQFCINGNALELMSTVPKFYQADFIRIFRPCFRTVDAFFLNFQGRQATLFDCQWGFSRLRPFMNRWKSGEAFQKLEYFKMIKQQQPYSMNLHRVPNVNGMKHIDTTKKPPTHSVPDLYTPGPSFPKSNTDPITSHTYIVRETDNRVASVSFQGGNFSFGVWDKTEEEFLRMVK